MSKKGLSLEEKKRKMLESFHETKDFYQLKELEKIAPKTKGIVQQSVKDVLDDLKGDGLVDFDKIGTSNYFWSFPSAAGAIKQARLDKLRAELSVLDLKVKEMEAQYTTELAGREETAERAALLLQLVSLQELNAQHKIKLEAYGEADPIKLENKKQAIELAREACVLWTDNALVLFKLLRDNGVAEDDLRQGFDLAEGWDEVPPL